MLVNHSHHYFILPYHFILPITVTEYYDNAREQITRIQPARSTADNGEVLE